MKSPAKQPQNDLQKYESNAQFRKRLQEFLDLYGPKAHRVRLVGPDD